MATAPCYADNPIGVETKLQERQEMNEIKCSYCHEKMEVWFAAYGKHSCFKPQCRQKHDKDGETYFQKVTPSRTHGKTPVVDNVTPLDGSAGSPTGEMELPFVPP